MIGSVISFVGVLVTAAIVAWWLQVLTSKPSRGGWARCHECESTIDNGPVCEACGAARPLWYSVWMRKTYREWVRANLRDPLGIIHNRPPQVEDDRT